MFFYNKSEECLVFFRTDLRVFSVFMIGLKDVYCFYDRSEESLVFFFVISLIDV